MRSWVGFDLDGTLAHYETANFRHNVIGPPVPKMVAHLLRLHHDGHDVRIFTARVGRGSPLGVRLQALEAITNWCQEHLGFTPEITCEKDFGMIMLYDDRCVSVKENTGEMLGHRAEFLP